MVGHLEHEVGGIGGLGEPPDFTGRQDHLRSFSVAAWRGGQRARDVVAHSQSPPKRFSGNSELLDNRKFSMEFEALCELKGEEDL